MNTTDPEEVRANLQYLRDHKVCETLEQITKALLIEKPKQPVATILRVLQSTTPRGIGYTTAPRRTSPLISNNSASSGSASMVTVTHVTSKSLSTHNNAHAPAAPTPRDESLTSETSAFSIHSVDMGEFLSEFRQAYSALTHTRSLHGMITRHDLLDLLDIVAVPTPDTRMLENMFSDIDVHRTGKVPWETFLARINYKIQGKYHNDVLRMIYTGVEGGAGAKGLSWGQLKSALDKLGLAARSDTELTQCLQQCGAVGADGEPLNCTVTLHDFGRIVPALCALEWPSGGARSSLSVYATEE